MNYEQRYKTTPQKRTNVLKERLQSMEKEIHIK